MNLMKVERPGMLSTLQDTGRIGRQQYGVSVNGPMDEWSHRLANALVGNAEDAAVLECTLTGPRLSFSDTTMLALCGARMRVMADGIAVPYDQAVLVRRGVTIDVGERLDGVRLYIAVRGGLNTEPVLGSRSTNVRAGFGGFKGRALKKGDQVPVGVMPRATPRLPVERRMVQGRLPLVLGNAVAIESPSRDTGVLRFIRGPQWSHFTLEARKVFDSSAYEVTVQSDRMGARLHGPALPLSAPLEMVSEATAFGTVQVPPDGQPIVLMADRQSAGGYPKIAYVASADLPVLAQSMPGDLLHFTSISQADAEQAWRQLEELLAQARERAATALAT